MKMSMDRDFVKEYQVERVRNDMKEFKERYTDGDLRRSFGDQTGDYRGACADILKCEVEAFDAGWAYGETTCFKVTLLLLDDYLAFYKIKFYCDMQLVIDNRDLLTTVEVYKRIAE